MRAADAKEMLADIEQAHRYLPTVTILPYIPIRFMDLFFQSTRLCHYLTNADFSLEGEIANTTSPGFPVWEIQRFSTPGYYPRSAAISPDVQLIPRSFSINNDRGNHCAPTVLQYFDTSSTINSLGFVLTVGQRCLTFLTYGRH